MKRRTALALIASLPLASVVRAQTRDGVPKLLENADALDSLKTVIVSIDGREVASRGFKGASLNGSTNIKSASKSIVSALVGIAIDRKILEGVDQPIASVLRTDFPPSPDPRLEQVTIGNLLSMQSGLERMSGPNYGRWVSSRNWVRMALGSGFAGEPGGGMLYSTGSTHLLSAILTKASGKSTLALARDWFSPLDGFSIGSWERDPQGIYLGGNQMAMTARSLLAFGELYRRGGVTQDGEQIVSQNWIDQSWVRRTNSVFNGDGYGYCWFIKEMAGEMVYYAWGYGGQMLYIVPSKKLSVVMTSRDDAPSARTGYRDQLHGLMGGIISAV
ncbi:CubicO group peptidase (beta-lactamase class C family) [Rhizobium skierniewicense]|uniref:CubicO group peptidase (Beta-lactamase class C family) n=1 Tax=Rhizobium skierniewicense TaxID=984260 RepID=A0A7W6CES1_9HYPH|nr:serine hydrolase [Rhizobium skierniewicense]MBB3945871.1 CubicO group peptidase (beta-lactamase class C family) [Rhizobium skierniewicense]